jgi:hypothetical protein
LINENEKPREKLNESVMVYLDHSIFITKQNILRAGYAVRWTRVPAGVNNKFTDKLVGIFPSRGRLYVPV